jgi:excisionase family DNA binding protein
MADARHEKRARLQRKRERVMAREGYVSMLYAAQLLGLSRSTVYGMLRRGDLVGERVHRHRYVRLSSVRARLQEQAQ